MQRDGMKGKKALSGLCLAAAVLVKAYYTAAFGSL